MDIEPVVPHSSFLRFNLLCAVTVFVAAVLFLSVVGLPKKTHASTTGQIQDFYPVDTSYNAVQDYLTDVAFDGHNLWYTGSDWNDHIADDGGDLFKMLPGCAGGCTAVAYPVALGDDPLIAFDGTNMWVTDTTFGGSASTTLMEVSPSGTVIAAYSLGSLDPEQWYL